MYAAYLEEPNKIKVRNVKDIKIKHKGDVMLKVLYCALCGMDLRTYRFGDPNIRLPHILGHEIVGQVVEIGSDNFNFFKEGDIVSVFPTIFCGSCYYCFRGQYNQCENIITIADQTPGGFAEYMIIPEKAVKAGCLFKLKDTDKPIQASIAEPLGCVINGQEFLEIGIGDTVLIFGAGPIGLMHAELAKIKGASKVIIAEVSDKRLSLISNFSVDISINSNDESIDEVVKEITQGKGVDVAIVAAPSGEAQISAVNLTRKGGKVSFFGGLPKTNQYINLNSNIIHYKEISIFGAYAATKIHHKLALDLILNGQIDADKFITHTFSLNDIEKAFKTAMNGECIKCVIRP